MNELQGYLVLLADSNLFGALATISFIVALIGVFQRVRNAKAYRVLVFISLMFMPVLHVIGTILLNRPPA